MFLLRTLQQHRVWATADDRAAVTEISESHPVGVYSP